MGQHSSTLCWFCELAGLSTFYTVSAELSLFVPAFQFPLRRPICTPHSCDVGLENYIPSTLWSFHIRAMYGMHRRRLGMNSLLERKRLAE